jgi:hypothetical protein
VATRARDTADVVEDVNVALGSKAAYPSGGSNGDLLTKSGTTTAWAAPTPQGLTLITTQAFSTVSSVSVDNCFNSTYANYVVLTRITANSTNSILNLRLRVNASDASGSDYGYGGRDSNIGGTGNEVGASTATSVPIGDTGSSFPQTFAEVVISDPAEARYTLGTVRGWNFSGTATFGRHMGWRHALDTAYDGFTLLTNTGTITGTFWLYGYRKA